jgi:hypothetical protein
MNCLNACLGPAPAAPTLSVAASPLPDPINYVSEDPTKPVA